MIVDDCCKNSEGGIYDKATGTFQGGMKKTKAKINNYELPEEIKKSQREKDSLIEVMGING